MGPKSSRKKKQSLALVVLIPTAVVGKKRKAKDNVGQIREKMKEGESSVPIYDHDPLYFTKDEAYKRYNRDLSLRKFLNGHWIDLNFFDAHNFEYSAKMDDLGWTPMTTLRDNVYPDLVAHFYANAKWGQNSDTIKSYVKWVKLELNQEIIRK